MKSKKMLAQIAAFSLVFGMTGVVSSWADEIILDGTTVKFPNDAISLVKNEVCRTAMPALPFMFLCFKQSNNFDLVALGLSVKWKITLVVSLCA